MHWVDSLSHADRAELVSYLERVGAPAFELYLILTLRIVLSGPFAVEDLAAFIVDYGNLNWHRVKHEFDLRDGSWHIKRGGSP